MSSPAASDPDTVRDITIAVISIAAGVGGAIAALIKRAPAKSTSDQGAGGIHDAFLIRQIAEERATREKAEAENVELRRRLDELEKKVAELRVIVAFFVDTLRASGQMPNAAQLSSAVSDAGIGVWMVRHFTLDELRNVAYDLGAASDDIAGDTTDVYTRNMLTWARHRGRSEALADALRRARPGVEGW